MTPEIEKLVKVLNMLSADNDHLALVAARKVHGIITTNDWSWEQLLANGASSTFAEEQLARVFAAGIARGESIGYGRGVADAQSGAAKPPSVELGDDVDWAKKIVEVASTNTNLSDMERQFTADMLAKIHRFGKGAWISQKQWDWVRRIETKLQRLGQL